MYLSMFIFVKIKIEGGIRNDVIVYFLRESGNEMEVFWYGSYFFDFKFYVNSLIF